MLAPVSESVPEPTFVRPPPAPEKMPANVPEVASPTVSVFAPSATVELATLDTAPSVSPEALTPEISSVAPAAVRLTLPLDRSPPAPERATAPPEIVVPPV